ncbi:hypothetical protein PHAVU_005G087500 [Phaseolus vulgaris]|uniref:Uncharacterized protein n=1 Tax=Phaseolus vulgaris TaxID=3885 RepID=V7BUM8_PHAVU|nr:hypothetical protein PHAVU_005G087500g [Phaseolus vulgaris]ESW21644.1 hypothetical protein PHAVU_005G087500g [Phaseolus vulgaris]
MDFDPEFPVPSYREREAISHYLKIEQEFMPHRAFYTQSRNAHLRLIAVKTVVQLSEGRVIDAYIPYIAMNYFDRFVSSNPLSVRREAIYNPLRIMRMEFRILSGLNWRMRSVTPFHFLDYYYPTFKRIGGFKRESINEIIVQSQGDVYFTQFRPSEIAMSALLAATYLGYSSRFTFIEESISISRSIKISGSSGKAIFSMTDAVPSTLVEASGSNTQTTQAEEELENEVDLQVQEEGTSSTSQFRNTVMDDDDEEEEPNVAPLARRRRRNSGEEDETEEKKQGEEKETRTLEAISEESGTGEREDKSERTSDEFVEDETGARDDNGKVPSEESVQAESGTSKEIGEAESRAREDKGKAVQEISEVQEENENELRRRKGKGKAVMEIGDEEEENENELRRRQRKGNAVLKIRDVEEEDENELRRRQRKGNAVLKIRDVEEEDENELRRRQRKGKAVVETRDVEEENENEDLTRRVERPRRGTVRSEVGQAPLQAMNFQLRWPISVRPGEYVRDIDRSLQTHDPYIRTTRRSTSTRGTDSDPDLVSNGCQCTIM